MCIKYRTVIERVLAVKILSLKINEFRFDLNCRNLCNTCPECKKVITRTIWHSEINVPFRVIQI